MDFLRDYGLFLLQAMTTVVAILIATAGIVALASKSKDKGKIRIKSLNDKFQDMVEAISDEVLSKKERKQLKAQLKPKKDDKPRPRIFVLHFDGDIKASPVAHLREEVNALLTLPYKIDEVIVCIESPGGMVPGYGLAASQLARLKTAGITLTACVDKVAASGGYLMAAVANKILAAPFAIVGSIGVVAQLPNFHRFLKKHNIDFEQITAGEFKRTLSTFGENTAAGRQKFQEDVEDIHTLFKDAIKTNRPNVDIEKVATGAHWLAKQAQEYNLVDELITSDDYCLQLCKHADLFELRYATKKSLTEKISGTIYKSWSQITSVF